MPACPRASSSKRSVAAGQSPRPHRGARLQVAQALDIVRVEVAHQRPSLAVALLAVQQPGILRPHLGVGRARIEQLAVERFGGVEVQQPRENHGQLGLRLGVSEVRPRQPLVGVERRLVLARPEGRFGAQPQQVGVVFPVAEPRGDFPGVVVAALQIEQPGIGGARAVVLHAARKRPRVDLAGLVVLAAPLQHQRELALGPGVARLLAVQFAQQRFCLGVVFELQRQLGAPAQIVVAGNRFEDRQRFRRFVEPVQRARLPAEGLPRGDGVFAGGGDVAPQLDQRLPLGARAGHPPDFFDDLRLVAALAKSRLQVIERQMRHAKLQVDLAAAQALVGGEAGRVALAERVHGLQPLAFVGEHLAQPQPRLVVLGTQPHRGAEAVFGLVELVQLEGQVALGDMISGVVGIVAQRHLEHLEGALGAAPLQIRRRLLIERARIQPDLGLLPRHHAEDRPQPDAGNQRAITREQAQRPR